MTVTDEAGNVLQSVKEVQGNRERLTTTLEGEVIHEHTVDFKIRRTGDVRVFTYWNREITQGSGKGKRFEEEASYLYQLRGDRMIVITGMLNDDPPVVPQLEVWKRLKR